MRRRFIIPFVIVIAGMVITTPAWADKPPPGVSCQDFSATTRPGNSANSPGSPFNEPGINSQNGGTGGQNYSDKSQYDRACFQQSQHTSR
jgi:hypothetical protein